MPRPRNPFPKLCTDATGRCFCKVNGKFITLGRVGNPETQRTYAALLANLATSPLANPSPAAPKGGVTVSELCLKFTTEVLPKYKTSSGKPSAERDCFKGVIKVVRGLFGSVPAVEFGPLKLRLVRERFIATGWSRKFINKQVGRLRYMFRWAASWELVPTAVADSLRTVPPLTPGESVAPETKQRQAVPESDLNKVRAVLCQRHKDIFDLLLLTGARPGELLGLRMSDLDRSGEVWRCSLERHKNTHRGQTRTLFFNAKAQELLAGYLSDNPEAPLFRTGRKTFSAAIRAACLKAEVDLFTPHALRHTTATRIADEMGTEAAQRLLGHATRAMTEHYSKAAEKQALAAVKSLG